MQPITRGLLSVILIFFISLGIEAQVNQKKMNTEVNNPLLCDTVDGICSIPGAAEGDSVITKVPKRKPIRIEYFTDPICSSCWAIEPQLKKLKLEYGDYFEINYRMGGLLKDWTYNSGGISKPSDVAHHWDELSKYYMMPMDGNVWLTDPLDSSYPPSIAFKAAQLQDKELALVFLRRLREMVFIENKNITKWEFISAAAAYAGLDSVSLKKDFHNSAIIEFESDLKESKNGSLRGFPTLFFFGLDGVRVTVHGFKPYNQFERAILNTYPGAVKKVISLTDVELFKKFRTLTTQEFAVLTNDTFENANNKLEALYQAGKLTKIHIKNGDLWSWKATK